MSESTLAEDFEHERRSLLGLAYQILGSVAEAEDAVQEAWLHLMRTPRAGIVNLGAWLRTVVARVCLDLLRQRRARREEALGEPLPDPVVRAPGTDPEQEALLGEAVGLALQCVLQELPPAERVAFVLHDAFGMSFDEIAPIVDRTPVAARQLASRGRRRVRELPPDIEEDPVRQREAVEAFVRAVRAGDVAGVVEVLDPGVVLRLDVGGRVGTRKLVGADAVAEQALQGGGFRQLLATARSATINGGAGLLFFVGGRPQAIVGFTVVDGRIAEIAALADRPRAEALVHP